VKFPVRAFIVGDGEEKQNIINYIKNKNLDFSLDYTPATFHLTSWIKEIDRVNSGMDIICLTSLNEGTPVSLIEAQASGKPIVSTKTGGIENIVLENKTALLSEKNDLHNFSKNLLSLVNDSNKRKLLSKFGLEKSKDFHYDQLVNNIKNLYENNFELQSSLLFKKK
jgi:glycosyltransferase involved in cell wall biosynthesis